MTPISAHLITAHANESDIGIQTSGLESDPLKAE
jgi:hypothetical protein